MSTPYFHDDSVTLYVGDATEVLSGLPDASVHCVVTSPPYWGLRDYGTGRWVGGNPHCPHLAASATCREGGTTGIAARAAGHAFVGIDVDPASHAIARRRLAEQQESAA